MRIKKRYQALGCGVFLLLLQQSIAAARELAIGEQFQIPIVAGTRFSVGNPEVISVRLSPGNNTHPSLLVRAKSQGYSDLLLMGAEKEQRWEFRVVPKRQAAERLDLKTALASIKNLRILSRSGGFLLQGRLRNLDDYNLLMDFLKHSPAKYSNQTELEQSVKVSAFEQIQTKWRVARMTDLEADWEGNELWLKGTLASAEEIARAVAIARAVVHDCHSALKLGFEAKEILRFKVQILEVIRSNSRRSGLQWSEAVPGLVELHQKLLKGAVNLTASLEILAQHGQVRVLSKPEIALNSQGFAELWAGGEIPIPLRSTHYSGIQWKPYGLKLRLEVPGTLKNLARTHVLVEISTLDQANAQDGIPATRVNRLETQLDLAMGKTSFLSGLTQDSFGEHTKGVPFLESIPLLGELFKSRDFQNRRSELVIAVTALKEGSSL